MVNRNLILIHRGPEFERDFDEIATKVNALDRGITVYHLPFDLPAELPISTWGHPTLTIALASEFKLPIRRGPILRAEAIEKLSQQQIFRRNGIPTPAAVQYVPGMKLDPIVFGEFVILKPMDLGQTSKGEGVFLFRRRRLDAIADGSKKLPMSLGNGENFIIQKFIDTGRFPCHYRVQTFLGEVIYSWRQELIQERPELQSSDDILETAVVASQGGDRTFRLNDEPDVLDLARKVHACLPQIPMLAVDIVRDCNSGRLYVLECNAGGNSWHFSSAMGKTARTKLSGSGSEAGRLILIEQFKAFDLVSELIVQATVEMAA